MLEFKNIYAKLISSGDLGQLYHIYDNDVSLVVSSHEPYISVWEMTPTGLYSYWVGSIPANSDYELIISQWINLLSSGLHRCRCGKWVDHYTEIDGEIYCDECLEK